LNTISKNCSKNIEHIRQSVTNDNGNPHESHALTPGMLQWPLLFTYGFIILAEQSPRIPW